MMALASNVAVQVDADLEQNPTGATLTFEQVYEECFPFVWRTARRLGVDDAALDDVCQEVFVVVHRRLSGFEGRSSVRTWVFSILTNAIRTHRRTKMRKREADRDVGVDLEQLTFNGINPDERAGRGQAADVARRLLAQLDDDKRTVFVLAELEEMSVKDIADGIGVNVNTAHARLRAARKEFATMAARYRAQDARRLG